jgi:hypothetical protein
MFCGGTLPRLRVIFLSGLSVTEDLFDMAISSRGESYVLGGTGHEHERLIRQARIFNPFT